VSLYSRLLARYQIYGDCRTQLVIAERSREGRYSLLVNFQDIFDVAKRFVDFLGGVCLG
jgi:FtsZ-interacting cell division protein YlmF